MVYLLAFHSEDIFVLYIMIRLRYRTNKQTNKHHTYLFIYYLLVQFSSVWLGSVWFVCVGIIVFMLTLFSIIEVIVVLQKIIELIEGELIL